MRLREGLMSSSISSVGMHLVGALMVDVRVDIEQ